MIWKILIFALAGYALYRLIMNDKGKKDDSEKQVKDKLIANGELVQDPVCGTYVDVDSAVKVRNGDKVFHFCGYECRDAFIKKIEEENEKKQVGE